MSTHFSKMLALKRHLLKKKYKDCGVLIRMESVLVNSFSATEKYAKQLPQALNVLSDAHKLRVNQLELQRIGLQSARIACIRTFEVANALDNKKLLYIHLSHAMAVEKYEMNVFKFSPDNESKIGTEHGPSLMRMLLERCHTLRTITARIYSPPEIPLAYVCDLEGVRRTAIVSDGEGVKTLFQIHTTTPSGWTKDAKITSRCGGFHFGHFTKLDGYQRSEIMLYLRLRPEFDIPSKCIILGTALFLMTYDYVR